MRRVLITGASGQDGTLLAENLTASGHEVHGLIRPGQTAPGTVNSHVGDLGNRESVESIVAAVKPETIFNLGGISSVGLSWDQPGLTGLVTGQGAVHVLDSAWSLQERTGSRVAVIQASSAEVFGSPTQSPQNEETPLAPLSPYGAAKAYAQNMVSAYRKKGLAATTLILYAHESTLRPEGFVTRKITKGAARIAINGGGTLELGNLAAVRDWGWAPDYVEAMVLAAADLHDGAQGTEYLVATGEGHTVEQFVREAFAAVGVQNWREHVTVNPKFFRPADPALLIGDSAKIREELGWRPTRTFRQIVSAMCQHDLQIERP